MPDSRKSTYQRKSESADSAYKRGLWDVAFGLQKVDGLEPSAYARSLANDNVHGLVSLVDVGRFLDEYQREGRAISGKPTREEEADKVSQRIVEMLDDGSF